MKALHKDILLIALLGIILPISGSVISILFFNDWRFSNYHVHGIIEFSGSIIAAIIFLCLYLNKILQKYFDKNEISWVSSAIISMGVLDGFHAFAPVGNNFVWLHSIATFLGGFLFAGIWLCTNKKIQLYQLPIVTLFASFLVGYISLTLPNIIPKMLIDGSFTLFARFLNILGGLGFVFATFYLFKRYIETRKKSYYLLAAHCLLFGVAGVLFELSSLWDAAWWWWHILRLAAYLVLTGFIIENIAVLATTSSFNLSLVNTKRYLAGIIIFIASLVIFGWFTKNSAMIQIHPSFAPMQFNTALGFILSGIGILAISFEKQKTILICAILIGFISGIPLYEYTFHTNIKIDDFFAASYDITTKVSHLGRMSPVTATCFFITSILLFTFRKPIILLSLSGCLLLITFLSFLSYLFGVEGMYGVGIFNRMAIHTSISFFILSIAFLIINHKSSNTKIDIWSISPIICSIILTVLTLFAWQASREFIITSNTSHFKSLVEEKIDIIEQRFTLYRQALLGGKGLLNASNYVSRDEWKKYVDSVNPTKNLPGTNGIGYIDYVHESNLEQYLNKSRSDGAPNFVNRPKTKYPDKYIIKYIEPVEINKAAVGLDVGFEKNRREGVIRARDTGEITLTKIIFLVQDNKKQAGFLLLEPVYEADKTIDTIEQRRKHFLGMSYSPFMGRKFMADIHKVSNTEINFEVYDGDEQTEENLIFKEESTANSKNLSYLRTATKTVFAGRQWTIIWHPNINFSPKFENNTPIIILTAGIVITIFFTWMFYLLRKIYGVSAKQIEIQRNRLDHIIENAVDGLIVIDTEGAIEMYNPACEKLFGYKEAEVLGKNIKMLMPNKYAKTHDNNLSNYTKTKKKKIIGTIRQLEATNKDGKSFPIDLAVSEITLDGRKLFSGIIRDVSERKKSEEQLKKYAKKLENKTQEAEQATKMKSSFLASMSHEIRTPMNGIFGMAELINQESLSKKQQKNLETLMGSAESLLVLIDDILDFSKIEAGKLDFENISINLASLAEEVAVLFSIIAEEKGVEIILNYDPNMPEHFIGDPVRIKQIINNLLSNAIKFTPEGHILIEFEPEKNNTRKDNKQGIVVSVTDTGIGIPKEHQDKIFDKFSQADGSTTRNYGGTGLGLAICRELSHIMGGEISLESQEGKGSTFCFTIYLELDNIIEEQNNKNQFKGKSALIVDDVKVSSKAIARYLKSIGMKCKECSSYKDATAMLDEAHKNNKPYDFCFVDYTLPEINGETIMAKFQENPNNSKTNFIMMASQQNSTVELILKNSIFKTNLIKPTNKRTILNSIEKIFATDEISHENSNNAKIKTATKLEGIKILAAEDNRVNQAFIKEMLEAYGCEVHIAANGEEAFAMSLKENYEIILMDCQMPIMDGYMSTGAIIKHFKQKNKKRPPIIALTANAMKDDRQKCIKAGMDDYISKPIRTEILITTLLKWLQKK